MGGDGGSRYLRRLYCTMRYSLVLLLCIFLACKNEPDILPLFHTVSEPTHGIAFRNDLREREAFNIVEYLYYYNGGGVGVGDFDGDGLVDIYLTGNEVPNRLYRNRGDFRFEDVTDLAGMPTAADESWSTGVSVADVNGDGRLDIYVSQVDGYKGRTGCNLLYLNESTEGILRFREAAAEYGLQFCGFGQQAAFLDYDRDGDLDVYLLAHSVHSPDNYGDSKLRDRRDARAGDRLLRNDNNRFVDVSKAAGIRGSKIGYGLSLRVADFNRDYFPDIYVTNDFAEQDYLYINQQDGTFKEEIARWTASTSQFSMGVDAADLDGNGSIDLMTLDMRPDSEVLRKRATDVDPYNIYQFKLDFGYHYQYPRNHVQLNHKVAQELDNAGPNYLGFQDVAELTGLAATDWSWSVLLEDFDLDGRTDVFVTNGIERRPNDLDYLKFTSTERMQQRASNLELAGAMPSGRVANRAFRQTGPLEFEPVGETWGLAEVGSSNGAAVADFDNDGDPDLIVNNLNAPVSLYRNDTSTPGITVRVRNDTSANRYALGITAFVGEKAYTQQPVRGWQSSSEAAFYVPRGTRAVKFRQSLLQSSYYPLRGDATTHTVDLAKLDVQFNNIPGSLRLQRSLKQLSWSHRENSYPDFDVEKLLPRRMSTEGPGVAVADLGEYNAENIVVGGAAGQGSGILELKGSGNYSYRKLPVDTTLEIVDIQAFDADGNAFPDLYFVNGVTGPNGVRKDQLLLNNGGGEYRVVDLLEGAGPGSFAVAFDYDGDGDTDIFRAGRYVPGAYGISPKSYLLENRGGGSFVDVSKQVLPNQRIGMLTSGQWVESERALYLVGEWMKPTRLDFANPRTVNTTTFGSGGWYFSLAAADVDGDGDTDLIGGNLGQNTRLRADAKRPLRLYVKDFDGNGAPDPLLTHHADGAERLFITKDELMAQLPHLRKRFSRYAAFAEAPFSEVFSKTDLQGAVRREITNTASVWWEQTSDGWEEHPLPQALQTAPLHAIAVLEHGRFYFGGNDAAWQPSIGRQGGMPLQAMRYSLGTWTPDTTGPDTEDRSLYGRSIRKLLPVGSGLLIATNDGPLFRY